MAFWNREKNNTNNKPDLYVLHCFGNIIDDTFGVEVSNEESVTLYIATKGSNPDDYKRKLMYLTKNISQTYNTKRPQLQVDWLKHSIISILVKIFKNSRNVILFDKPKSVRTFLYQTVDTKSNYTFTEFFIDLSKNNITYTTKNCEYDYIPKDYVDLLPPEYIERRGSESYFKENYLKYS